MKIFSARMGFLVMVCIVVLNGCDKVEAVSARHPISFNFDRSTSSAIWNEQFRAGIAMQLDAMIMRMAPGTQLTLRQFGDGRSENFLGVRETVLKGNRDKVRLHTNEYIMDKSASPQVATEILSLLESRRFDCGNGEQVYVIGDGIEESSRYSVKDFAKGKSLPKPLDQNLLEGCTVIFWGIGNTAQNSLNGEEKLRWITLWQEWVTSAGGRFVAYDRL